ncbi:hypothetical protein N7478_006316 [Penicillium angulare]|uniref:uncharacterized protein n=1 Tax=Penicillium angulare TaxID=116970 RepID=UPI002540C708|nr:uncharacterized protein N7478_006316 [Penicillium angulare]KAJ5280944.1 hypothetical protein N7478_006316 [Penicillium angulare]
MASLYGSTETQTTQGENGTQKHGARATQHTFKSNERDIEQASSKSAFNSKKALWAFLVLCYSTGPTSAMVSNYVSAAILSAANLLGHQAGSHKPCPRRGTNINCRVKFGAVEIDYASYTLYLRAISRSTEGVLSILTAGLADYSYYRKTMMMTSIFLFGLLALPFAALTGKTYSHLTALSVLYCLLTTVSGIYTVIEGSYIPIFMRSTGWFRDVEVTGVQSENSTWNKGVSVSVLALVSSNVGGLTALIIGVILVYGRGSYVKIGYHNYLLAITIAGCITIVFAIIGQFLLPSVRGKEVDSTKDKTHLLLAAKNWFRMLKSAPRYSEAFKLCIGWVLWNTGYSNHLALIGSLFIQVTGFSTGSHVYSVWSFTSVIFACMGSLGFMYLYPRLKIPVKAWVYTFLMVNILCVLWGCIGISDDVTIGYKHQAEFWVEQVLFMSTSSALRAYNRAIYSTLIPENSEAQFFGLEITLDLATGWINPLVMGVIQNRTHNLRFPMIPNLLLMIAGLGSYWSVDVSKGIAQAKISLSS